jgi:heme exporter protein CcmD
MTHLGYILAAYLASAIVLIGMAAWIVLDLRTQRAKLKRLEDEGRRRPREAAR